VESVSSHFIFYSAASITQDVKHVFRYHREVSHVGTTWQRYAGYGFLPAESQKGAVRHVYGRTAKADCGYG